MKTPKTLIGGCSEIDLLASKLNVKYRNDGYNTQLILPDSQSDKAITLTIRSRGKYLALAGQLMRATITLNKDRDNITYQVGHGQWLDKAIVGAGTFLHIGIGILLPVVIVGLVRQVNFFDDIEEDIIKIHSSIVAPC